MHDIILCTLCTSICIIMIISTGTNGSLIDSNTYHPQLKDQCVSENGSFMKTPFDKTKIIHS